MASSDEDATAPALIRGQTSVKKAFQFFGASNTVADLEAAKFEELANDGHRGEVLAIDAGDGMDFVFSGGEDCTARIWKFYQTDIQCYRLYHLLDHCSCQKCHEEGVFSELHALAVTSSKAMCKKCETLYNLHPEKHEKRPAVTSVAFAGTSGPAISVSRLGTLHVIDVDARSTNRFQIFDREIRDVRVKKDGVHNLCGPWLISVVSGKEGRLYEIFLTEDKMNFDVSKKACFWHDQEVMYAEHVPGDVNVGAVVATGTAHSICLWSLEGQKLYEIKESSTMGIRNFTCIRVSRAKDEWSWLVASSWQKDKEDEEDANYFLSFWPLKSGMLVDDEAKREKGSPFLEYSSGIQEEVSDFTISPDSDFAMVQYKLNSDFIQISPSNQDPVGTKYTCETVQIEGCPHKLFVEDANFDKYNYLISLKHKTHCNEMCMRLDYDEGGDSEDGSKNFTLAAVLVFTDGSVAVWDLQGNDRGQKTSEMRNLSVLEISMPVMLRFLTFAQVITFAFGPSTNFSNRVNQPIAASSKLVQFDFLKDLIPGDVSLAELFLPEAYGVISLAAVYVLLALTATPEKLTKLRMQITHSRLYDEESWWCCCFHVAAYFVGFLHSSVCLILGTCSTILVVPMFKIFAKIVDCEMQGKVKVLSADPSMVCYHNLHLKLVGTCAILLPIYFATLLPYAIVMGDPTFVTRASLFNVREWRIHAERQATMTYQGAMHPDADTVYFTRVFELCIKIAMPCIVILTTEVPLTQTLAIFCCGLGGYVLSLTHPPMVDRYMNAAIRTGQLFTAVCMFCGVLTVVLPIVKDYSIAMLSASFVFSVALTCCTMGTRRKGSVHAGVGADERPTYQLMNEVAAV